MSLGASRLSDLLGIPKLKSRRGKVQNTFKLQLGETNIVLPSTKVTQASMVTAGSQTLRTAESLEGLLKHRLLAHSPRISNCIPSNILDDTDAVGAGTAI